MSLRQITRELLVGTDGAFYGYGPEYGNISQAAWFAGGALHNNWQFSTAEAAFPDALFFAFGSKPAVETSYKLPGNDSISLLCPELGFPTLTAFDYLEGASTNRYQVASTGVRDTMIGLAGQTVKLVFVYEDGINAPNRPDDPLTGLNNRSNEYYARVNHRRIAKWEDHPTNFSDATFPVFPGPGGVGITGGYDLTVGHQTSRVGYTSQVGDIAPPLTPGGYVIQRLFAQVNNNNVTLKLMGYTGSYEGDVSIDYGIGPDVALSYEGDGSWKGNSPAFKAFLEANDGSTVSLFLSAD